MLFMVWDSLLVTDHEMGNILSVSFPTFLLFLKKKWIMTVTLSQLRNLWLNKPESLWSRHIHVKNIRSINQTGLASIGSPHKSYSSLQSQTHQRHAMWCKDVNWHQLSNTWFWYLIAHVISRGIIACSSWFYHYRCPQPQYF